MGGESPKPASTSMGAVFLSYASQDAQAAQRICEALCAAGIEVWFDQSELRGGDVCGTTGSVHINLINVKDDAPGLYRKVIEQTRASWDRRSPSGWDVPRERDTRLPRRRARAVIRSRRERQAGGTRGPYCGRSRFDRLAGGASLRARRALADRSRLSANVRVAESQQFRSFQAIISARTSSPRL